jgi:AcrR family transcriptional regulator
MSSTKRERLNRQQADRQRRRAEVRDELVTSALTTLSDLGYARTGLRDIAEQAGKSVGLVHYYFEDKTELIIACVRIYKADFITSMGVWVADDLPAAALQAQFVDGLARTIEAQAPVHRFWYDIRAQALFDPALDEAVGAIEQGMVDQIGHVLERLELPATQAATAYASLDGHFRYALAGFLAGQGGALVAFRERAHWVFASLRRGAPDPL